MPERLLFSCTQNSRVLMLSQRNLYDHVGRCGGYEFEDVICQSDRVDMFAPRHSYRTARNFYRAIKGITRSSKLANALKPDPNSIVLDRQYDLFFVLCASAWDILSIRSIKNWRQNCRKAVCYVDEIWRRDIPFWRSILELLQEFDHVFLTYSGSVQDVAQIIGRPCDYLPPAADTLEFSPCPLFPSRTIDVYNMGRRSSITHDALLNLSLSGQIFYYYDTPKNFSVISPTEHRRFFANLLKRSRYYLVNRAKVDQPDQIRDQVEIGNRYFEGAAGGAILLGEIINTEVFRQHFDWQDAVIPVPYDCPDIADILTELNAQPDRLARISRDNAVNALLRHDWVYRWETILQAVGLEPTAETQLRQTQLSHLAEKAGAQVVAGLL